MTLPSAEVRIRRMSAADLERVMEIAGTLPEAPHWPVSAYVAAMDAGHRPQRIALVAEFVRPPGLKPSSISRAQDGAVETAPFQGSGRIVGFTVASLLAPEAELETIAVAKDGQRRGIGSLFLQALFKELKAEQLSKLVLEVRASNLAALRFYGVQGFEQTGQRPRYYADPEEDAILLELKLT